MSHLVSWGACVALCCRVVQSGVGRCGAGESCRAEFWLWQAWVFYGCGAEACWWLFMGSIIAGLFITCILGVFLCRACLFHPGLSEISRDCEEAPENLNQPIPTIHLHMCNHEGCLPLAPRVPTQRTKVQLQWSMEKAECS